jgi:hypothetical protein
MHPKEYSSRRFSRWRAIGRPSRTHQGITSKTIDKVTEYGGNILIPPRTLQQDEQMAILREREVYQLIGQVALQPFDKSSM